ncbi:8559_t:CDS:2, partial [Paraglomus brasilianum]
HGDGDKATPYLGTRDFDVNIGTRTGNGYGQLKKDLDKAERIRLPVCLYNQFWSLQPYIWKNFVRSLQLLCLEELCK